MLPSAKEQDQQVCAMHVHLPSVPMLHVVRKRPVLLVSHMCAEFILYKGQHSLLRSRFSLRDDKEKQLLRY